MIIKRTLRQAGFSGLEVAEAENGRAGLDALKTSRPALVLCDWNMPEMAGIEVLRALRDRGDQTPFGFITSEVAPDVRVEASSAGAQFFITKPFGSDTFRDILSPFFC